MGYGRSEIFVTVVFTVWLISNISINLYNTYVLSKTGFKFPILLTATNKIIGWVGSMLVMVIGPKFKADAKAFPTKATIRQQMFKPMVIAHGFLTALNISFNNWSLVTISLSLNQLLKSLAPLPTAALSVALEKKSFAWDVWASMGVVVVGTALAAIGNVTFAWGGFIACMVSVLATAGWTVFSAMLLQLGQDKMNAVDLVFYSSPWCILLVAVMFCIVELSRMIDWVSDPQGDSLAGGLFVVIILCGGLLGFSYDLIHNQFVKLTSSMTMAVMGNTKLILLIVISMLTLEARRTLDGFFAMNIIGCVIGVCGCIWYSYGRLQEKKALPPLSEPLDKSKAAGESSKLLAGDGSGGGVCCAIC